MKKMMASAKNIRRRFASALLAGVTAAGLLAGGAVTASAETASEPDKTETVYVKADMTGRPTETEVEIKLKKAGGSEIKDVSILSDIKNKDGDEEYSEGKSLAPEKAGLTGVTYAGEAASPAKPRELIWENLGDAVRYTGKTDRSLPVGVTVTYWLDGKKTDPASLAGKSGHLKMRFDYENKTAVSVEVDGVDAPVETKVPFTAMTAALLPSDVFSSVEITNGRLLEMGSLSALVGVAFPGLEEALRLGDLEETEDIELPEYVELEADVTDFELAFTTTIFTPGLLKDMDLSKLDDIDDLKESMEDLRAATNELEDGSAALADGLKEFQTYYAQYLAGADKLGQGITALGQGLTALNDNKTALETGASALSSGLTELNAALAGISLPSGEGGPDTAALAAAMAALGSDMQSLAAGAQQIGTALPALETAAGQIKTLAEKEDEGGETSAEALAAAEARAAEALKALESAEAYGSAASTAVSAAKAELDAVVIPAGTDPTETARSQAQQALTSALNDPSLVGADGTPLLTEEQKAALLGAVANGIDLSGTVTDTSAATAHIDAAKSSLSGVGAFTPSGIDTSSGGSSGGGSDDSDEADPEAIAASVAEAASAIGTATGTVSGALTDMQNQLAALAGGLESLKGLSGFGDQLASMAGMVSSLQSSVGALKDGSAGLNDGFKQFGSGIAQLADGGRQLNAGFAEFAKAGGLLNEGLSPAAEGASALAEGMRVFNDEAISEITKLGDGDIQDLALRIRAAKKANALFETFTGLPAGYTGSVSFVIETEAIELN